MHALTLMNDTGFLEAARHLGALALQKAPHAPVGFIFETVLLRGPEPDEMASLQEAFSTACAWYRTRPDEARKVVSHGQSLPPSKSTAETAAAALVANLVLNLDEALTRE
jgi:hypothetical protein